MPIAFVGVFAVDRVVTADLLLAFRRPAVTTKTLL
jgi:hypothetical protein